MINRLTDLTVRLAVVAGILATAALVGHAAQDITFTDSFESYTNGQSIIGGAKGWMGPTNDPTMAAVEAKGYTYDKATQPLPYPGTEHANVMVLQAGNTEISNTFNEASFTNVYIDMMVKLEQAPEGWEPPATNDIQAALFVDTNGHLVVYHGSMVEFPDTFTNVLTTLDNDPAGTGEWSRLTIEMDYRTQGFWGFTFFRIRLDGGATLTNENAVASPTDFLVNTGSWFFCANQDAPSQYLTAVGLSGTGEFDDFVVTNKMPIFSGDIYHSVQASVAPSGGRGGTMTPIGSFSVLRGSDTNFTILPTNYWYIADVTVNDGSIGVTNYIAFTNIQQSLTIEVDFDPYRVTNGVPQWWLAARGLATNDAGALAYGEGDPNPNWEKWLCSTEVGNSNSLFEILEAGSNGGTNFIKWVATDVDPDLPAFQIQRVTDLTVSNAWNGAWSQSSPRMPGTNTWTETYPGSTNTPWFYRLKASN